MTCVSEFPQLLNYLGSLISAGGYSLPLTGGSGPLVVTVIGISMAVLSLLLFFLRGKGDDKGKKKPKKRHP